MGKSVAILSLCFLTSGALSAQTSSRLSVSFSNLPLELILDSISQKTGYQFSYNSEILPKGSLFSLVREDVEIDDLLRTLLIGTYIEFTRSGDQIILKKKPGAPSDKNLTRQVEISGWCRELESKEAISGVAVYINGTTLGTTSDQYGNYKLLGVPPGSHQVVFSHIGYHLASYDLNVQSGRTYRVNGLLDFDITTLNTVEIVSQPYVSDDEWPKHYRHFIQDFLGTSANAMRCEILNPEALNFTYDEETATLSAEAKGPLLIHNQATGYKITYDLEYFQTSPASTSFYGKARFENLPVSQARERRRWRKNRIKSYNGSITHFFQSLLDDAVRENGFQMYVVHAITELETAKQIPVTAGDLLSRGKQPYEWILDFDGYLLVKYNNEVENPQYIRENNLSRIGVDGNLTPASTHRPQPQRSYLKLKEAHVTLDGYGQLKEPLAITTVGYWSWERIGELMPADYDSRFDQL